jgi:hypothetical protein
MIYSLVMWHRQIYVVTFIGDEVGFVLINPAGQAIMFLHVKEN